MKMNTGRSQIYAVGFNDQHKDLIKRRSTIMPMKPQQLISKRRESTSSSNSSWRKTSKHRPSVMVSNLANSENNIMPKGILMKSLSKLFDKNDDKKRGKTET